MGRLKTLYALVREKRHDELRMVLQRELLPARVYRRNALVIVRLTTPKPLPRALATFSTRWGGPGDEPLLQALRPRREGYRHHFEKGEHLLITETTDSAAAFNWFETRGRHDSRTNGYAFEYGPGAAWAFGVEVDPRHRLSGVFHKHWVEGVRLLRERGIDRVYGSIEADNPRSLQSHLRLGFELLWTFRMQRVLGVASYTVCRGDGTGSTPVRGSGRWIGTDPGPAAATVLASGTSS